MIPKVELVTKEMLQIRNLSKMIKKTEAEKKATILVQLQLASCVVLQLDETM